MCRDGTNATICRVLCSVVDTTAGTEWSSCVSPRGDGGDRCPWAGGASRARDERTGREARESAQSVELQLVNGC
jgi:hypothetical protein